MTTRIFAVSALLLPLFLGACDDDDSGSDSGGASGGGDEVGGDGGGDLTPVIDVDVSVSGAVQFTGTFTTRRYEYTAKESCAAIVAEGSGGGGYGPAGSWQVPKPYFGTAVDGSDLAVYVEIDDRDYEGAGTYEMDVLRFGQIDFDGEFQGVEYSQEDGQSTSVVTIDGTMAGDWTFTELLADDGSGNTVSGRVSWRCRD